MKRFTLIPVGDTFEYQGERYSKTGPLVASNLESGRQRMIPRSAMVLPLERGVAEQEPAPAESVRVELAPLLDAFTQYHNGCLEWLRLAEKELSTETTTTIRRAMEEAKERFVRDITPR